MNPKIIGILVLIVGLGVGLYFINSGGGAKFGSLLQPPGSSSSTLTATPSTTTAVSGVSSTASASSSGFSWASFFSSLFAVHNFPTIPTVGPGSGGGSGSGGSAGSGGGTNSGVTPPAGFTVAQLSPYYQKVRLSGVSRSEITISTYPAFGTPTSTVDITGWEIKTNRGGEFVPQVQNIYEPTGVPIQSDIILALNQVNYVNLYSNSSPANLRVNSCMGYLNTPQQFNPGFVYTCPQIDTSQISQFSGSCQNYIRSLYNCQSPDFGSSYFPRNDYQCEDYLRGKYNYTWCVSAYASGPNFLSNEWRVWMGTTPLDPYHDIVKLVDRNGLLVDVYSY